LIEVRIMKYKVRKSMKRALLIGNGKPNKVALLHVGKNFKLEDAKSFMESLKIAFD